MDHATGGVLAPVSEVYARALSPTQTLMAAEHVQQLQQLRRQVATAVLLLAWRHLYRQLLAMPGGQVIANRLYSYVFAVSNDDPKHVHAAYARISKESEEQYMTIAEKLRKEGLQEGLQLGRQEGRQEGRLEGRQEGLQMALIMLFEKRFGAVPPAMATLIETSSPAEAEHLMRRILTAATVDDLLA